MYIKTKTFKTMKTFEIFKNGTVHGEIVAKNIKEAKKQLFCAYGKDCFQLEEKFNITKELKKIKDLETFFNFIDENYLSITTCENEYKGNVNNNYDTYQLAETDDDDYFGEMIYNKKTNKLKFILY